MIEVIDQTQGPLPALTAMIYGLNNARKGTTMAEFKPLLKVDNYAGADRREKERPQ